MVAGRSAAPRRRRGPHGRGERRGLSWLVAVLATTLFPGDAAAFDWYGRVERLAEGLASPSATARRETLERLAGYPIGQVSGHVLRALEDDDTDVRLAAARLLGRGRVRPAVEALAGWIAEPDDASRRAACVALGEIGDPAALGALTQAAQDSDANVRQAAVEALSAVGTDGAILPLVGRLGDSHPRVRQAAARGLGELAGPAAVVPLVSRIQDPVPQVRAAVVASLGRIGDQRAATALIQALRDGSPDVRAAALSALARLGDEALVTPAVGLLGDEDPEVRRRAVAALGAVESDRAIEALVASLSDPALAPAATAALAEVGSEAVPAVGDLLRRGSNHDARRAALEALVRIGDASASDAVVELLTTGGALPEPVLLSALGALRTERAMLALVDRLRSDRGPSRRAALLGLAPYLTRSTPDPRAAEGLVVRAREDEGVDRLLALLLLVRSGDPRAVELAAPLALGSARGNEEARELDSLLGEPDRTGLRAALASARATGWPLRTVAVRVLGASRSREAEPVLLELLAGRHGALRDEAARALGAVGSERALAELVERLDSPEPVDRAAVVLALGLILSRTPSEGPRLALEDLLVGPDETLALRAADALARAGDAAAAPALARLLERPDRGLRRKAVEVLGELGGPVARRALLGALADEDPLVRGLAAWALGKVGGEGVVDALLRALGDPGWSVAVNAAGALARLGDPAASERLCEALPEARGSHLRANLLLAAASSHAPCARAAAVDALLHASAPIVRSSAARVVGAEASSEGPEARRELTVVLAVCAAEDPVGDVRESCRSASERGGGEPPTTAGDWLELYLFAPDRRRARPGGRYLLVLPDGLVKAGATDANAFAREAPVRPGPYRVEEPVEEPGRGP